MLKTLLTRRPSPTVDLYFLDACADWVGPDRAIRRVALTVFESDSARLVIRHDAGAPRADRKRRLVYLLDDAVFAGLADRSLPAAYRVKLRIAEFETARRLLPRADVLVASGPEVVDSLPAGLLNPRARVLFLDPCWIEPFADLSHFCTTGDFDVAFLGAGTHRGAIGFLRDAIRHAFALDPRIRFTLSSNHRVAFGAGTDRVRFVEPTAWPAYRREVARLRQHLSLYPLPDTPFARARSTNKLIEHALTGSGAIYSDTWPPGATAAKAGAGFALPPDPALWGEAIVRLSADRHQARVLAEGVQRHAAALNSPETQRGLWSSLLFA